MHIARQAAALVAASLVVAGCSAAPMPKWPVSSPAELCGDPTLAPDAFCMPSKKLEGWLAGDYKITKAAKSTSGITQPYKLRLEVANGVSFNVKFKRAPDSFEAFNNSPRRELAAYEIQKLYLDPDELIVPPTVLACIPTAPNAALLPDLEPHPDADCAVGIMAFWVEGLTDDDVIDKELWSLNAGYRDNLGNLNILTALIGHQDDIGSNFLRSKDPARPRLVSVDNGLTLGAMGDNPIRFFSSAWSDIRVPLLPARSIERLSAADHADLHALSVLAQLERRDGTLRPAQRGEALSPDEGVHDADGVVQLGLTTEEIRTIGQRIMGIVRAVEDGSIKAQPAASLR